MRRYTIVYRSRENIAVDCQRRTSRHSRLVSALQHHRSQQAHFGLEQAMSIGRLGALERIGAHEFGEAVRLVRRRLSHGAHLMQDNIEAAFS
jgi:hypothetical protein